ncbi:unnamed protein product, partial [Linum tenue]
SAIAEGAKVCGDGDGQQPSYGNGGNVEKRNAHIPPSRGRDDDYIEGRNHADRASNRWKHEGHRVPPLHKSMLLIPWLVRIVGELPDDVTDAQIERYARIYLICLVGGFLFPSKSGGNMHCMWLRVLLEDWDEIGRK